MYDTINLWLGRDEAAGSDLLACLSSLSNVSENSKDGQYYHKGNLKNYTVFINDIGISLKGSLAKYHLNDNINTLTRGDSHRAIEQMADELGLPIGKAKVNRIDFAKNMLMRYEPEAYYQYLGDCQYYQRLLQPKSLYYNNSLRIKLFYNKIAEAKKKRVTIPEVVQDQNLLRYELRFVRRLSKQFKTEVTASQLADERFYMELMKRWIQEYQNIQKLNLINLNHSKMRTPKDFWKQGNLHWIKLIGQDTAMRMVDDMRARQVFEKPEYYSRLRKEIRELCSKPDLTETSELITELDKKVNRVQMYYR
jgi:hypothetical protein